MDPLHAVIAEHECTRLTYRYCRFADGGQASRLAELFTEDGSFTTPDMSLRGRRQIARTFAQREAMTDLQTVHLCTNVDIEVIDEATASGWVNLCLFRRWREAGAVAPVADTRPVLVGSYEDDYVKEKGLWLIASRVQRVTFVDPDDPGWRRPTNH